MALILKNSAKPHISSLLNTLLQ